MTDTRTAISEIVTGLGLFGFADLPRALAARPRFITNVDDTVYDRLDAAFENGSHAGLFETAWDNGACFARADDGLRGRPPWSVEWKGPHRPPAYEQIPADLRVDHARPPSPSPPPRPSRLARHTTPPAHPPQRPARPARAAPGGLRSRASGARTRPRGGRQGRPHRQPASRVSRPRRPARPRRRAPRPPRVRRASARGCAGC